MSTVLLDSWVAQSVANSTTLVVTLDAAVPVGAKLILGTNKSASGTNGIASVVDSQGHTWTKRAHTCRANTHDMSLHDTIVTTALAAGDTVTITYTSTSSRKTAILASFSETTSINADSGNAAYGAAGTSVGPNGSTASESASTTGSGSGLVIGLFSRASGASVTATPTVGTAIDTVTTSGGSSDRGITMAYLLEDTSGVQTMTANLTGAQSWGAIAASFDAVISVAPEPKGEVIVGGAKKSIASEMVIVGGAKKVVVSKSIIVGGAKRPIA